MFIKVVMELVDLLPETAAIWDKHCPSRAVPYLVGIDSDALIWPSLRGGTFIKHSGKVDELTLPFVEAVRILTARGELAPMDSRGVVKLSGAAP